MTACCVIDLQPSHLVSVTVDMENKLDTSGHDSLFVFKHRKKSIQSCCPIFSELKSKLLFDKLNLLLSGNPKQEKLFGILVYVRT